MKKRFIILIIIGFIFSFVPFFLNEYSILKLVSLLAGIILIVAGFVLNGKRKILKLIIVPIFVMIFFYSIDYLMVSMLNHLPVISLKSVSSDNAIVYSSFLYRVYSCNNNLIIDNNYEKPYACDINDINNIFIDNFLSFSKDEIKKYYNKFVHLSGKVAKTVGDGSVVLSSYDDITDINGYVHFEDNKEVFVEIPNNKEKYYIYDYVEVVGLVSKISYNEDRIYIVLKDSIIKKSDIYNNPEIIVNNISGSDLVKASNNIYYLGLQGIYYKYDDANIYELVYLLNDKRVNLDNLINNIPAVVNEDAIVYSRDDYTILNCTNSQNLIFASKKIKNYSGVCSKIENNEI